MNSLALDHIVVFVEDLRRASEDYAGLGFQVTPGGVHTGGFTRNALIPFADGTYLELLAPTAGWKLSAMRLLGGTAVGAVVTRQSPLLRRAARRIKAGEGLVDFALRSSPLAGALTAAGAAIGVDGPISGGRVRPDGQEITWQLAFPKVSALPFLIEDTTPRTLRVPEPVPHPNGAAGVHAVSVVTTSFDKTVAQYQALLGREPFETVAPVPRSLAVEFRLERALIRLLAPIGADHPLRAHLARRGEGIFSVVLRADRAANLDPARAHGAPITLARS